MAIILKTVPTTLIYKDGVTYKVNTSDVWEWVKKGWSQTEPAATEIAKEESKKEEPTAVKPAPLRKGGR